MSLRIFTPALKAFWFASVLLIGLVELFPFDNLHVRPLFFYTYESVIGGRLRGTRI